MSYGKRSLRWGQLHMQLLWQLFRSVGVVCYPPPPHVLPLLGPVFTSLCGGLTESPGSRGSYLQSAKTFTSSKNSS